MKELNHFDPDGNARMVDVGEKPNARRSARASAKVKMKHDTGNLIRSGKAAKGDVLNVARIAGISGSKWTPHLIPMCHPILVDSVDIEFDWLEQENDGELDVLMIHVIVNSTGRTGVEMEALSAATVSALTVYDMCKSVDRDMEIYSIFLVEKTGGKSGHYVRQGN